MNDLTNAQVGDKLLLSSGCYCRDVAVVTKTTRTQVHVGSRKFNRRGHELGASKWSRYYAQPVTDAEIAEMEEKKRHRRLVNEIHSLCDRNSLGNLTLTQLEAIRAVLPKESDE
jgi:hypothetical protein